MQPGSLFYYVSFSLQSFEVRRQLNPDSLWDVTALTITIAPWFWVVSSASFAQIVPQMGALQLCHCIRRDRGA